MESTKKLTMWEDWGRVESHTYSYWTNLAPSTATRHSTLGARYMYLTDVFPHTQLDCQATTGIDRGKNMLLGVEVKNTLS